MEKGARGKFDSYLALLKLSKYANRTCLFSGTKAVQCKNTQSASAVEETVRALNTPHTGCATEADLFNSRQKQAFYYNLKGKALPELQSSWTNSQDEETKRVYQD